MNALATPALLIGILLNDSTWQSHLDEHEREIWLHAAGKQLRHAARSGTDVQTAYRAVFSALKAANEAKRDAKQRMGKDGHFGN